MQGILGAPFYEDKDQNVREGMSFFSTDYKVWRDLDTGDKMSPDFVLECGKKYEFSFLMNTKSSDYTKQPDIYGKWSLDLKADCSISLFSGAEKISEEDLTAKTGAMNMAVSFSALLAMIMVFY